MKISRWDETDRDGERARRRDEGENRNGDGGGEDEDSVRTGVSLMARSHSARACRQRQGVQKCTAKTRI